MQGKTRPRAGDLPICLTKSRSKCRAAQQPLNLPANSHRLPPSQAREATCLACFALEASRLGNLSRQGQQRRKSGQGERTAMLFDCIWLGRTSPIGYASLRRRPTAAPPNDFCINPSFLFFLCLNLPQTQISKYLKGSLKPQRSFP